MIIKVMKSNYYDFWLVDNVENIHVEEILEFRNESSPVPQTAVTQKVACSVFQSSEGQPKDIHTWNIDFKLKGEDERQQIIFNTIAYICGDNGKTLEIIRG